MRSIYFFASLTALSLIVIMGKKHISYRAVLSVIYVYLFQFMVYSLKRSRNYSRELWRRQEDIYNALDAINGLVFVICIDLKNSDLDSVTMITTVPFMAVTVLYSILTVAPKSAKNAKISTRIFYTLQTLVITAQLDGIIIIDWRAVFGLCWIYIGVIGIYFTAFALIFVLMILSLPCQQQAYDNIGLRAHFLGTLWYVLYYGLCVLALTGLSGLTDTLDNPRDMDTLRSTAIVSLVANVLLLIYTVASFKYLTKFVILFSISDLPPIAEEEDRYIPSHNRYQTVNLKTEKKEGYFVMLSTTYFQPLQKNFFAKNDERIKRIRDMLSFKKQETSTDDKNRHGRHKSTINMQSLMRYKEEIDNRFSRNQTPRGDRDQENPMVLTPRKQRIVRAKQLSTRFPSKKRNNNPEADESNFANPDDLAKQNLSADNLGNLKDMSIMHKAKHDNSEEEKLCYLCFDSPPNAVLMNCRHGGICYECAIALVKKKNECMECRSVVDSIVKIDPNPKFSDIVKAVEVTKVTKVDPFADDNASSF